MSLIKSFVIMALILSACACSSVKPWERGNLALPEMAWLPDKPGAAIDAHVYHSKEGSSGGAMAAGGGCGCN